MKTALTPRHGKGNVPSFLGGALAAAALCGGVAYAVIPSGSGVISACYLTNNGQLRVIDPGAGQACLPSELPLAWNQVGAPGSAGVPGATGAAGPVGPSGPPGAFTGVFTSPNGLYRLQIDNEGIVLSANGQAIRMTESSIDISGGYLNFRMTGGAFYDAPLHIFEGTELHSGLELHTGDEAHQGEVFISNLKP